jgi:CrcB protein
MNGFLLVAIGGAIGASMRYGVGLAFTTHGGVSGAWATLFVNIVGSFLLGALMGWMSSRMRVWKIRSGCSLGSA